MRHIDTLVIGGGQSGLAMSRCLTALGIEHVMLERGRIAERWRSASWDSLRLLTPRWQSRLPGWTYEGDDPDGYMHHHELVAYLEAYRASFEADMMEGVEVTSVRRHDRRFAVTTTEGGWLANNVVVATGDCQRTRRPSFARRLDGRVFQLDAARYRNPSDLPEGGVLVVGASSTGVQLASELHRSGRPVTLSVGRHTRLPRMYRGRDILWWLDRMGVLDERAGEVAELEASRAQPSLQLVGSPDRRSVGLATLAAEGVRVVGRALAGSGRTIHLDEDLAELTVAADVKLARLLDRIERHAVGSGLAGELPDPEPFELTPLLTSPERLDLAAEGIRSVLWATGYARSYAWLDVPVLDHSGEIVHQGGITPVPGLYVLGLRFLQRRKSSFLDGAGDDARALAGHIAARRVSSGAGAERRAAAERAAAIA